MAENAELSTALGAAEAVANSAASHGHSSYVASAEAEAEAHMRREAASAAGASLREALACGSVGVSVLRRFVFFVFVFLLHSTLQRS